MVEEKQSTTIQKLNKIIWTSIRIVAKIAILLLLLILLFRGLSGGYRLGYRVFAGEAMSSAPGRTVTFTVKEGQSVNYVGRSLKNAGLIEDSKVFLIQKYFYKYKLVAGTYHLSTAMTTKEIWQELNSGPSQSKQETTESAG